MRNRLRIALVATAAASLSVGCLSPQAAYESKSLCWVEFSRGEAPGAMGAAGATQPVWQNTASGLFVRHPRGNVLIDAGWSANAAAEMAELSPQKRPFAERVITGLQMRSSAPEALRKIGITAEQVHYVLPTHGHYDHMGGAADLKGATVLLTMEEQQFLTQQLRKPDIVAASNIRSIQPRIKTLTLSSQKYRGFESSLDLYGDGSIVVVPLPGHTPGSVGVFVNVGGKEIFHIGDAAFVSEAIDKGLPKIPALRAFTDHDPAAADAQVRRLAQVKKEMPRLQFLPAHDRFAWQAAISAEPGCLTR